MKIVSTNDKYNIYSDDVKTYDKLPGGCYSVRFSNKSGFYLEAHKNFSFNNEKIYGNYYQKANKVLKAFGKSERNLGVILSGDKGIGKSLFARLVGSICTLNDIPVIIVDKYIEDIADYIESIDQEVMVLFDEFDKTYTVTDTEYGVSTSPQNSLLSLFDGTTSGKKLFILTCNSLDALSDYIINRPGRFHYNIRFDYPSGKEIEKYLEDQLDNYDESIAAKIIDFSAKINLTYDCLRAICFEINNGETFESAIEDLNIINMREIKYSVEAFNDLGINLVSYHNRLDMFKNKITPYIDLYKPDSNTCIGKVSFNPEDAVYDIEECCFVVTKFSFRKCSKDHEEDFIKPDKLIIKVENNNSNKSLRYF